MFLLVLGLAAWGILHSLFASTGMKDLLRRRLGNGFMKFYRLLYNIFAAISFLPILYLMVMLPDTVLYQVPAPFSYVIRLGQLLSLILLLVAVLQTDVLSFVGLRQLFEEEKTGVLITRGLYKFVRHPLYTFSLLILWLSPSLSLNSFVVYLGLTLYILIGIIFEERKLVREFGRNYEEYRSITPMLIPGVHFRWNKQDEKTV
jgi:protein-S-isoprenylcysteine O-methyltransferase Ste14